MTHFADRLIAAVRTKGNALCVGLDPRWDNLPHEIRVRHKPDSLDQVACAFEEFCLRVLDIVAPHVPVVKPQSAFRGLWTQVAWRYAASLLRDLGLITPWTANAMILPRLRGVYAEAALGGMLVEGRRSCRDADSLTVSLPGSRCRRAFLEAAPRSPRRVCARSHQQ